MKKARAIIPALCVIGGCGGEVASKQAYTLMAFEAVGVQPDADGMIVPDARERLPAILLQCEINNFYRLNASDVPLSFGLNSM